MCNGLRNHVGLTHYLSSGIAAHAAGGLQPGPASFTNGTSQARTFVDYAFRNRSDYLKIVNAMGRPDQDTQNAMVAAAHAKGKSTMTQATQLSFFESAILSKTDIIQHAPADLNLSRSVIDLMVQQKQSVTPTMEIARIVTAIAKVDPSILAFLGESQNSSYSTWRANVMAMHAAGIPILAGTDAAPQIPLPFSPFGWTFHQELANLVDAGLSTTEALRAATIVPATLHKLHGRGNIAVGMHADLVLLSPGADPVKNISTTTKDISRIWIGGLEYADVATQPFPSFP
jgi:imidazolonepropionase-like amidohydrolase